MYLYKSLQLLEKRLLSSEKQRSVRPLDFKK